jgi:hypothetical protein
MVFVMILSLLMVGGNKEFLDTVDEQKAMGYTWHKIECREHNKELPAITIDTHTGKSLVCYQLLP